MTLENVLKHFDGNMAELARALHVSRQAVRKWANGIPEKQQLKIRHELLIDTTEQESKTAR